MVRFVNLGTGSAHRERKKVIPTARSVQFVSDDLSQEIVQRSSERGRAQQLDARKPSSRIAMIDKLSGNVRPTVAWSTKTDILSACNAKEFR
jgi:hypothetical protein